ncbi:MAG: histidine kinase, partial [Bacteroides sp.]|nr:histidine kinase [Bacteroides sp.]
MKKLLHLLLNPFVLPILPTIILILFLPFNYDRYLLEVEQTRKMAQDTYEWYDDLTMDGNSERIYMKDNFFHSWIAIYDHNETLYNQWNILGSIDFSQKKVLAISGDYDQCGKKELFLFTIKNDSIFLHSIHDLNDPLLTIQDRFITETGAGMDKPDPFILPAEMNDLNGDGKKELIFGLGSGFSRFPRNVFAYYIDQDSLVRSPDSYYNINGILQADITGDGKKEIMLSGQASANVSPSLAKYHDYSNWIMVLDHKLEFLFEPVEIPGSTYFLYSMLFEEEKRAFKSLLIDRHKDGNAKIYSFTPGGEVLEIKDVGMKVGSFFVLHDQKGKPIIIFSNPLEGSWIYDYPTNELKQISSSHMGLAGQYDLEGDGKNEAITLSSNDFKIFVFREGMKNPAVAETPWSSGNPNLISIKESTTSPPQISYQLGQDYYLFNYGPNPAYYLNFLYFLLIYAGMIGFAVATRKAQQKQFQRRLDTEKKITELQLSLVKNQLDPHFTINAMNAILYLVSHNENEKAHENIKRFSRLYRSLLLSADAPLRSLREELDFCRDYLELEKARFGDAFSFSIELAEGVDMEQQIPKMIIQTHAE